MSKKLGGWAFLGGLIIAVLISLVYANSATVPSWVVPVLAILGLIVGFFNIREKELVLFLVASVAFMISFSSLSSVTYLMGNTVGNIFSTLFNLLGAFIAPAAAINAIKAIYHISKD